MQAVNNNSPQYQIRPDQQRIPGKREIAGTTQSRSTFILPEDVVTLSSGRDPVKRAPSVPVSAIEKKALRDSFTVYA